MNDSQRTAPAMPVRIIDATLREGNQAPGVRFTLPQAVRIARMLAAVGVDMIECGHAFVGSHERERIGALAALDLGIPLLSHARARREDILAAKDSGADWVGMFCGINRISRFTRLGDRPRESVVDMIRSAVCYAKELGLRVRYTLEDGTRTPVELAVDVFAAALREGADRICYADTLGAMSPGRFGETIRTIRSALPSAELELHVHDDRGFAMANAWIGIEAGASWISTSVNGLGERCGITDLAVLLANLCLEGRRKLHDAEAMQDLCTYVGAVTRAWPDVRRPVVGKHAFTHTARLHSQAVRKDPAAYAVFDAGQLGRKLEVAAPAVERTLESLTVVPPVISAVELKYHRAGPGSRYVMIDDRFVKGAGQYCIVRDIPSQEGPPPAHVDAHRHTCDSLFMFIGRDEGLKGLTAEVQLDGEVQVVDSPTAVFIPAGAEHSYRVLRGEGLYVNHVLAGDYNGSLLEVREYGPAQNALHSGAAAINANTQIESTDAFEVFSRKIKAFLAAQSGRQPVSFGDDDDLVEEGTLDSIVVLELLLFVEAFTGRPILTRSLETDSIRTIRRIYATLVQPKTVLPAI